MNVMIEMSYLSEDHNLLFTLADELDKLPGIRDNGASGGLILDQDNQPIGREGAISVAAKSTRVVRKAVDALLPSLSKKAKVTEINLMIVKETEPWLSQGYLPPAFR